MNDMLEKLYAATAVVRATDDAREPLDVLREPCAHVAYGSWNKASVSRRAA